MAYVSPFTITAVGDERVGKTCLLLTYTQNSFPKNSEIELNSSKFENDVINKMVDGKEYNLILCDTSKLEEYEMFRRLYYLHTNCFLICYSIDSRASFNNVLLKWYPEVRYFSPNVPIILVGTKMDLRVPNSEKFVTTAEAKKLRDEIKAYAYVECSAKKMSHVADVFDEAVRAVEKKPRKVRRSCQIL